MKALVDAIWSEWDGSGALKVALPRFYLQQAPDPDKAEFPYGVYSIVAGSQDDTFNEECEDFTVQFDLYSEAYDATALMAIYDLFTAEFDYVDLTLAGWTCTWCRRELMDLTYEDGVWRYMLQYSIRISR